MENKELYHATFLTKKELEELLPWCQCTYHTKKWYDVRYCCMGKMTLGCLESYYADDWPVDANSELVIKTKAYKQACTKTN